MKRKILYAGYLLLVTVLGTIFPFPRKKLGQHAAEAHAVKYIYHLSG